jgi:hypothetical protein
MKDFLVLVVIVLLCSCSDEYTEYINSGEGINIYVVKDGQIERSKTDVDIKTLELEKTPWVRNSEIEFYDWSSHMFYLKKEKEREKFGGLYFVVKEDNHPLFLGYFAFPYSSSLSYYPSVLAWDNYFYTDYIIELGGFGGFHKDILNKNTEFRNALKKEEFFREGISVDLLSVVKKNSTTVEYTFEVTNLDSENISVLDPDKIDSKYFHYLTNGVTFTKGNDHYSSDFQSESHSGGIPQEWFIILKPGERNICSVELSGFSEIPEGLVRCRFSFPGHHPKNANWDKGNGRYWLGDYWISKELNIE